MDNQTTFNVGDILKENGYEFYYLVIHSENDKITIEAINNDNFSTIPISKKMVDANLKKVA